MSSDTQMKGGHPVCAIFRNIYEHIADSLQKISNKVFADPSKEFG